MSASSAKLLFRMACKHHFEGVDAFDIDSGSYESIDYIFSPAYLGDACMEDVCEVTRKATTEPKNVVVVGGGP